MANLISYGRKLISSGNSNKTALYLHPKPAFYWRVLFYLNAVDLGLNQERLSDQYVFNIYERYVGRG